MGGDCYSTEKNQWEAWRWCGQDGERTLTNSSDTEEEKQLALEFRRDSPEPYEIALLVPNEAHKLVSAVYNFDLN